MDLGKFAREVVIIVMQKATNTSTITVPVPNHSEIRIGTLQSIIRQSGIPKEYFENK
jgi:hypothetical protein